MERKVNTTVDALTRGQPLAFAAYLKYCKNLRFEDRPDYHYLRRLFRDQFAKCGYQNDLLFDWCVPDIVRPPSPDSPGKRLAQKRKVVGQDILNKRTLRQHLKFMENFQRKATAAATPMPKVVSRVKPSLKPGDQQAKSPSRSP